MDIDPYLLHISTPITFYRCHCGITIHAYPVSSADFDDPEILAESMCVTRPIRYPYTWYVFGDEAAIVNVNDLRAYEETHQHPPIPSYSYYQEEEEQEDDDDDDDDETVDDVAMNDSFQQASDRFVAWSGLTKKEISKNLGVTKYREEESEVCVVCQVEFEKDEKIGVLQCKHRFHPECIEEWLLRKNVCPLCKVQALKV